MTAPVAHAAKISANAPSATAAFSERRRGRLGVVARPGAGSEPGAPVSGGLEAGSDSPGCGMENVEAMRASDARTTEARSDFILHREDTMHVSGHEIPCESRRQILS